MKYYVISTTLNALSSAWACLFVILSNPKSKTNRIFAYYAFFIALWATFYFLWITSNDKNEALFYMRIACIAAIFIPSTFMHFTCNLLNKYKEYSLLIKSLYLLNFIMIPLGFTKFYISHTAPQYVFPNWPMAGPLFFILLSEYLIAIGFSLLLIHKELKITLGSQHEQLKHVFWGIIVSYLGGATCFPYCYGIPIPPFGLILISFYSIFITYAIFRYQLMDIRIIFKRSLVYSSLITIITLFYFLSIYTIELFFQGIFKYHSIFISLTLASVITLAFIPLKNIIQSFIERYLFKGTYLQITKENELFRQEIIQTERLKAITILASGMAHEIKNPLTPIKTFAEELPKRLEDKEFLLKFSTLIPKEVDRIDCLVQELLDYAKPTPPQLKNIEIHYLLDQTMDFLNNDLIKHKILLNKDYQLSRDKPLNLDSKQMKQAFLNILLNAIESMDQNGNLIIKTNDKNQYAQIVIEDNGRGINSEDLPYIFDPFFTKKDHGTGLGLSITHEIIKNHGGKIFVESVVGKGTKFTIQLPIS